MSDVIEIGIALALAVLVAVVIRWLPWRLRLGIIGTGLVAALTWAIYGRESGAWVIFAVLIGALVRELRNPNPK